MVKSKGEMLRKFLGNVVPEGLPLPPCLLDSVRKLSQSLGELSLAIGEVATHQVNQIEGLVGCKDLTGLDGGAGEVWGKKTQLLTVTKSSSEVASFPYQNQFTPLI